MTAGPELPRASSWRGGTTTYTCGCRFEAGVAGVIYADWCAVHAAAPAAAAALRGMLEWADAVARGANPFSSAALKEKLTAARVAADRAEGRGRARPARAAKEGGR